MWLGGCGGWGGRGSGQRAQDGDEGAAFWKFGGAISRGLIEFRARLLDLVGLPEITNSRCRSNQTHTLGLRRNSFCRITSGTPTEELRRGSVWVRLALFDHFFFPRRCSSRFEFSPAEGKEAGDAGAEVRGQERRLQERRLQERRLQGGLLVEESPASERPARGWGRIRRDSSPGARPEQALAFQGAVSPQAKGSLRISRPREFLVLRILTTVFG